MAFHMCDIETDSLIRELAARHKIGLTEAVRMVVRNELRREQEVVPLKVRIAALRAEVLKRPATDLEADKAFFDDLSGDS